MHYTLTVALPGDIPADELEERLNLLMNRFDESLEVPLHRDESVYAETLAEQVRKAKESDKDGWTVGLSDLEIAERWSGDTEFGTDGWPLTHTNPDGQWDWWVVGGRWGGAWHLRGGAKGGPLDTEDSAFGPSERAGEPLRTDNARWRDIVPESVAPTYAWLDLDGEWHTKWVGPSREQVLSGNYRDTEGWTVPEGVHIPEFMKFLAGLPGDTWLVNIDFHH
jgi:hypothetical protein